MFASKVFRVWFITALGLWFILFNLLNDLQFLADHWYYPVIMILGAFVAGVTPEGGGAVAFPILNIFLSIDREMARDFSLMIQSIGMTSASLFILTHKDNRLATYKPLFWMIPMAFIGFVLGMQFLQHLPVYIIQALFLSLITSFALLYSISQHRGCQTQLPIFMRSDRTFLVVMLLLGGGCASLFGTGADIILYTLLVTRFRLQEKIATHFCIILMAAISVLGFAYRHWFDQELTTYQFQTWLCAFPVVLLMAPFGAYVLHRINKEIMLRGVAILNVGQLGYFLCVKPSLDKALWAAFFTVVLSVLFYWLLTSLSKTALNKAENPQPT